MRLLIRSLPVALLAAPLLSLAAATSTDHLGSAQPTRNLTLLPGPYLLSPANATGEVVPGQRWHLATTSPTGAAAVRPTGKLVLGSITAVGGPMGSNRGIIPVNQRAPRFEDTWRPVDTSLVHKQLNFAGILRLAPQ